MIQTDDAKGILKKRARSKWYTQGVIKPLLQDSRRKLSKQYKRAWFCAQRIEQEGDKFRTFYCNSRACNVCNRIRTAKMMQGYIHQLNDLPDLQFVTLTVKAVKAKELKGRIIEMKADFKRIRDTMRKRKTPIDGFLKIECNYNADRKTFNPHFHIIISGIDKAEETVNLWLKMLNNKGLNPEAQNIRPLDDNGLSEVFKYTTKSLTKNRKQRNVVEVSVDAFDTIMEALHKTKVFQPIGCVKKAVEEDDITEDLQSQNMQGLLFYERVDWEWSGTDWINFEGMKLTDYKKPPVKFKYQNFNFLEKNGKFWESLKNPFERIVLTPMEKCKPKDIQWSNNTKPNQNFMPSG